MTNAAADPVALGYVRVSTQSDEQATSPATQRRIIEQECARRGWLLAAVFEDRYTGTTLQRAGLSELRRTVQQARPRYVVVSSIDRLGRDAIDALYLIYRELEPLGAELWEVGGVNGGDVETKLLRAIRLCLAEGEVRKSRAKITRALADLAQRGHWCGIIPYGYRSSKRESPREPCTLLPCAAEAEVVREIYRRAGGGESDTQIARRLTERGEAAPPRGVVWSASTVARVLRSRVYRGEVSWHGGFVPGAHEALVSEEQWRAAQRQGPRPVLGGNRRPGQFVLPTLACPQWRRTADGGVALLEGRTDRGGRYYELSKRLPGVAPAEGAVVAGPWPRLRAEPLEEAVLEAVLGRVAGSGDPQWWREHRAGASAAARLEELRLQLAGVHRKHPEAMRRYCLALDNLHRERADFFNEQINQLNERTAELRAGITALEEVLGRGDGPSLELIQRVNVMAELWDAARDSGLNEEERREAREQLRDCLRSMFVRFHLSIEQAGVRADLLIEGFTFETPGYNQCGVVERRVKDTPAIPAVVLRVPLSQVTPRRRRTVE